MAGLSRHSPGASRHRNRFVLRFTTVIHCKTRAIIYPGPPIYAQVFTGIDHLGGDICTCCVTGSLWHFLYCRRLLYGLSSPTGQAGTRAYTPVDRFHKRTRLSPTPAGSVTPIQRRQGRARRLRPAKSATVLQVRRERRLFRTVAAGLRPEPRRSRTGIIIRPRPPPQAQVLLSQTLNNAGQAVRGPHRHQPPLRRMIRRTVA